MEHTSYFKICFSYLERSPAVLTIFAIGVKQISPMGKGATTMAL